MEKIGFQLPDSNETVDFFVLEQTRINGADYILVTDSEDAPVCAYADDIVLVGSNTRLSLNTLSTPMAITNLLISAIRIASKNRKTTKNSEDFRKYSV